MSHTTTIETQVRDPEAVKAACKRLGLAGPINGTTRLFDGEVCNGWAVQLQDWNYPIVCDTDTGKVQHDNFGGRWGKQDKLDAFMAAYAVEKVKIEAKRKGHRCTEQRMPDGSVRITMTVGA